MTQQAAVLGHRADPPRAQTHRRLDGRAVPGGDRPGPGRRRARDWADIDAVVLGKAPDLFEGVMMPELFLADALGATGKPLLRVHTAGSVGGATAIVASEPGPRRACTGGCSRWRSRSSRSPTPCGRCRSTRRSACRSGAGAGGYFAPHVRSYIRRSGAPAHIGAMVAVKDRRNGALNPYAHLRQPDITLESVQASAMLWDPIRYDETCPSSDGACAVVIGDQAAAEASDAAGGLDPRHGDAHRADHRSPARTTSTRGPERDAAQALWRRGRHHRPAGRDRRRRDLRAVLLVRADVAGEPRLRRAGRGLALTEAGETAIGGRLPVNPSGGVLCSNPIGASGLLRFAEAAMQVMGRAGEHQVDGARTALGHAYGGGSQFFSMWVVGTSPPAERGAR